MHTCLLKELQWKEIRIEFQFGFSPYIRNFKNKYTDLQRTQYMYACIYCNVSIDIKEIRLSQ